MKKISFLCLLCVACLVGCSKTQPGISDFSGTWSQCEDNRNSDIYLEASITENSIVVNWKGDDNLSVYFAGDFENPTNEVSKYRYESTKDNTYKHDLLMSSNEDQIVFVYEDGFLTWVVHGILEDRIIKMEKID